MIRAHNEDTRCTDYVSGFFKLYTVNRCWRCVGKVAGVCVYVCVRACVVAMLLSPLCSNSIHVHCSCLPRNYVKLKSYLYVKYLKIFLKTFGALFWFCHLVTLQPTVLLRWGLWWLRQYWWNIEGTCPQEHWAANSVSAFVLWWPHKTDFKYCLLSLMYHCRNQVHPVSKRWRKSVHVFVAPWLDYCDSILSDCPNKPLKTFHWKQNAADALTRTSRRYHISPLLTYLHWLPVKCKKESKILLLTYKALNDQTHLK